MKKKTILIVITLLLIALIYGVKEFYRTREDSKKVTAAFEVSALGILQEFAANDSLAAEKYKGDDVILSVTGLVKELKKDEHGFMSLLLGDPNSMSSVICSMDTLYSADLITVKPNEEITVKGKFNGYNKDETGLLGSDIQMNLCVIEQKK